MRVKPIQLSKLSLLKRLYIEHFANYLNLQPYVFYHNFVLKGDAKTLIERQRERDLKIDTSAIFETVGDVERLTQQTILKIALGSIDLGTINPTPEHPELAFYTYDRDMEIVLLDKYGVVIPEEKLSDIEIENLFDYHEEIKPYDLDFEPEEFLQEVPHPFC